MASRNPNVSLAAELAASDRALLDEHGKVNAFRAASLVHEALAERIMPPEHSLGWLLNGLRAYLNSGGELSLDKAFGTQAKSSGATRPNRSVLNAERDATYQVQMRMLIENWEGDATKAAASAAKLVLAREELLCDLAPEAFEGSSMLSGGKDPEGTLLRYWRKWERKQLHDGGAGSMGFLPPGAPRCLVAYDDGQWLPAAVQYVWHLAPWLGWPKKELAEARKAGLRI